MKKATTKHSPRAVSAANHVAIGVFGISPKSPDFEVTLQEAARLIDRETGVSGLLKELGNVADYLAKLSAQFSGPEHAALRDELQGMENNARSEIVRAIAHPSILPKR